MSGGSPAQEVITTRQDAVGRLLNQWAAEKTAAGLPLITYENRDAGHSLLAAGAYPRLVIYQPAEEEKKAGRDRGPAVAIRPTPTVGNCSMASHPTTGGSLPRIYYTQPGGLLFLNQQYLSNNLFIYPEHQDHDIGGNGEGGWGDLFPANSPCTIISQGSSFTDMPFLNAVLSTIAAFDPDILTGLIRKRALMPTVQAIFRQSNKMVQTEEDYFTGKAHPVVFDSAMLDEEKMVIAAHTMTRLSIPPVVVIRAAKESEAQPGRHYFEKPGILSERLADSPATIARIFRSNEAEREITVSTSGTGDVLGRPLQIRWALLRGDPRLVKIESNDKGEARIRVKWHMPMFTETGIRTHRVDIGAFASNGISTSAPAFVTFYMLPNENRFYDEKGRISEIYYEAPNPDLGLPPLGDLRWLEVFEAVVLRGEVLQSALMDKVFNDDERAEIHSLRKALQPRADAAASLEKDEQRKAEAARFKAEIEKDLAAALKKPASGTDQPLHINIAAGLSAIADQMELFPKLQRAIEKLAAQSPKKSAPGDLAAAVKRLVDLGLLIETAKGDIALVRSAELLRPGERYQLRCLNLLILSQVLFPDALVRSTAPAFVDPQLTTPKAWRDVFRYDDEGNSNGWVRYQGSRTHWFDRDGKLQPKEGGAAKTVSYQEEKGRIVFSEK